MKDFNFKPEDYNILQPKYSIGDIVYKIYYNRYGELQVAGRFQIMAIDYSDGYPVYIGVGEHANGTEGMLFPTKREAAYACYIKNEKIR